MEGYWLCVAAVLKIPQIARSVFFRQVNSQCKVKSGYIVLDNPEQKFGGMSEIVFYKSRPVNMNIILVGAEEFVKFMVTIQVRQFLNHNGGYFACPDL